MKKRIVSFLGVVFLLAGCSNSIEKTISGDSIGNSSSSLEVTLTPFQPRESVNQSTQSQNFSIATPISNKSSQTIWFSPAVPQALISAAEQSGFAQVKGKDDATIRLDITKDVSGSDIIWIYCLVAPFPTVVDDFSLADLNEAWSGSAPDPFSGKPFLMEENTLVAFSNLWGTPAEGAVEVVQGNLLLETAWADMAAWAIIPFEELVPKWKVLSVDGRSPLQKEFDESSYPLAIHYSLFPDILSLPDTNRDAEKMTILAMTGVTALVRATADKMETKGILYPGEEVRDVLRAADITHISNEIPFMKGCPTPDPWTESLIFCSDPRYIELLEDVGTDVVELTGNHLLDHGYAPAQETLEMYTQEGWKYFGGGRDLQDSFRPALIEDHGNKLAFFGCNFAGPPSDWAQAATPGSTPCDFDQIQQEISNSLTSGFLPIMTFQYNEYYQPNPTPEERDRFQLMADAGAVIVSGSQSHVPAGMEFVNGSFLHYGIGNLFFDQMSYLMPDGSRINDTRKLFIDRHIFYDGHYIQTELLTYIIEDYSRPRRMNLPERIELLNRIFDASPF